MKLLIDSQLSTLDLSKYKNYITDKIISDIAVYCPHLTSIKIGIVP